MSEICTIDIIRSLSYTGIGASYEPVGSPTSNGVRLISFVNNTNGDLFFSNDGIHDYLFVAAGSFKLLDVCSNRDNRNGVYLLPAKMQWYVKQSTAPSTGTVYIEVLYGMP